MVNGGNWSLLSLGCVWMTIFGFGFEFEIFDFEIFCLNLFRQ